MTATRNIHDCYTKSHDCYTKSHDLHKIYTTKTKSTRPKHKIYVTYINVRRRLQNARRRFQKCTATTWKMFDDLKRSMHSATTQRDDGALSDYTARRRRSYSALSEVTAQLQRTERGDDAATAH